MHYDKDSTMSKALENMRQVKAALLLRGWDSVAAWALANHFLPVTARRAIYDWWHRTDREPLGGINRQTISALRAEIAKPEQRRAA